MSPAAAAQLPPPLSNFGQLSHSSTHDFEAVSKNSLPTLPPLALPLLSTGPSKARATPPPHQWTAQRRAHAPVAAPRRQGSPRGAAAKARGQRWAGNTRLCVPRLCWCWFVFGSVMVCGGVHLGIAACDDGVRRWCAAMA